MDDRNFAKILDGKYDNRKQNKKDKPSYDLALYENYNSIIEEDC